MANTSEIYNTIDIIDDDQLEEQLSEFAEILIGCYLKSVIHATTSKKKHTKNATHDSNPRDLSDLF